ncbi:MAG: triose-phosphate isomerase [Planctomycetes bacterium]|nr:triose-phosphate isomerase [Planctomycetota bacterium]
MAQHDSKRLFVGGNWKMNGTREAAGRLAGEIAAAFEPMAASVDAAIFPPFPYLQQVGEIIRGSGVLLGAQQVSAEANGAFTGQVSAEMLIDLGVQIVIIGHSECRQLLNEPDSLIGEKVSMAVSSGLSVMLCVGETWEERQAGQAESVCRRQITAALKGIHTDHLGSILIAYEPIWAIGTGRSASPQDASTSHASLRKDIRDLYDPSLAAAARILYGGSVNPANATSLFSQPEIQGALVGGASLKAADFASILRGASQAASSRRS